MINRILPKDVKRAVRSLKKKGVQVTQGRWASSNLMPVRVAGTMCSLPKKVCAISAVLIYKTAPEKLTKDLFKKLENGANALLKKELRLNPKYTTAFIDGFDGGHDSFEDNLDNSFGKCHQIEKVGFKDGLAARKILFGK